MNKIGKFEKVSFEQFLSDVEMCFGYTYTIDEIRKAYEEIEIPTRSTMGSAGYDFKMPFCVEMGKDKIYRVPTGIRCKMFPEWVLMLCPRSGLGCKYGFKLENTVGVIDSDYYNSDNEGHIMAVISQSGSELLGLNAGKAFMQGIFFEYGITTDDDTYNIRNGGFGSTD